MGVLLKSKNSSLYILLCIILIIGFVILYQGISQSHNNSGVHDMHMADKSSSMSMAMSGDPNLRYSVTFDYPENVNPNEDTQLSFTVYNAANGDIVSLFTPLNTKRMHMIVVNSDLTYYNHVHPELENGKFVIGTTFPKPDIYHIYTDFQPLRAREQQFAFTLPVGNVSEVTPAVFTEDSNLTKTFGNYRVSLTYPKPLVSSRLSTGEQLLTFDLLDNKSGKPIKTLKPYLGAFGHLVLINTKTFEYVHVHPNVTAPPKPDENGGPAVVFMPMGLYGPIKPGIYRAFAQFNPDNNLFTADFTINVE